MCAASRVILALLVVCTFPELARAQTPGSPGVWSGPPAPQAGDASPPAASQPTVPIAVPFTPGYSPPFTPPAASAVPVGPQPTAPAPGAGGPGTLTAAPPTAAPFIVPPAPVIPSSDPVPARDGTEGWRLRDAHLDRTVLLPTAETHPEGTWTLSSYEILVLQAGYALSDRTQVSLTFLPLVGGDDPIVPIDLSIKTVLVREGRVRVAALGSASGLIGFEEGEAFFGRAGAVTQLCLDDGCGSSANVSANLILGGPALVLLDGLGLVLRTGEHVALLTEVQLLHPLGRAAGQVNGIGLAAGIRFSGRKLGLDVAVLAPFSDSGDLPQVVPFLAGTYRFLP